MRVTGCEDCPLWGSEYSDCQHPDADSRKVDVTVPGAPTWCPLRKGALTLELDEESGK